MSVAAERCKGLHPYVAFLFQSALTTVCFTSIRGEGRFLTNEQFQKQFYTEEEAEKAWNEEVRDEVVKSVCVLVFSWYEVNYVYGHL